MNKMFIGYALKRLGDAILRCETHSNFIENKITVCEEWLLNPILFVDYLKTMPGYELALVKNFSIRRLNQKMGFEPGNVFFHDQEKRIIFVSIHIFANYLDEES